MTTQLRNSGMATLGELPWGTHICQFYDSREDLLEILVPWFIEGLRSRELCVWVVSGPLSAGEALHALRRAMPELPAYLEKKRIKILAHDQWYLESGTFNPESVVKRWEGLAEEAARAGLDGLRVSGDTSWVDEKERESFMEYEREVHRVIRKKKMLAICTYPRSVLRSVDIAEAVSSHAVALLKRDGQWRSVTRAGLIDDQQELREREKRCALIVELASELVFRLDIRASGELAFEWITPGFKAASGYTQDEISTMDEFQSIIDPESRGSFMSALFRVLAGGQADSEIRYRTRSGEYRWMGLHMVPEHHDGTRIIRGVIGGGRDITERKEAEERTRESERKYRGLYESISDGVIRVDTGNRITDFNPAFASMLGYSVEEVSRLSYADITEPDEPGSEYEIMRDLTGQKGSAEYEKEFIARGGRRVPASVRAWLLKDQDGSPAGFWAVVKDLTETRAAERQILNSDSLFKGLISSLPGTFYVIDRTGRMVKWNRALEDISGYSHDEIGKMHPVDFFAVSDRKLIREKMEDTFRHGAAEVTSDLVTRDGLKIPFHFRAVLARIDNEPYIIGTGTDISRWKNAEKALWAIKGKLEEKVAERTGELLETNRLLKKSEERFRVLVETTSDWVWEIDSNGVYTYVSPKVTEILGYRPEEVLGKRPFDLMPPDEAEKIDEAFRKIVALKKPFTLLENRNLHKDGREVFLETSGMPIFDSSGNLLGYRGMDRDITSKKAEEAERSKIQQQLIQSQKLEAIGVLAGGIAHDFNNLMVIIRLNNSLALKKSQDNEDLAAYLDQISAASERAEKLTRQLLIFSRRHPTETKALNLNRKVVNTLGLLTRLIGENIVMETSLSPDIGMIRADKGNIEQIIMNLVINARDAMPRGGSITLKTERVDVGSSSRAISSGSHVKLTVEDTGCGMDASIIKQIFEPFFSTKGPRGTGLGLAVVHNIIRELGGWIDVESRPGEGARFEIYFPAVESDEKTELKEEAPMEERQGGGESVLIVEDEKLLRKSVAVVLSKNGYKVLEAACAKEARCLFEKENGRINLVFSDMVLQDKDGIQLIDDLKGLGSEFCVLITSGYLDVESQWPAIKEKGYRFLQKPYEIPDLLRSVREALEKKF